MSVENWELELVSFAKERIDNKKSIIIAVPDKHIRTRFIEKYNIPKDRVHTYDRLFIRLSGGAILPECGLRNIIIYDAESFLKWCFPNIIKIVDTYGA